jgi:hypothetical protein
MTRQFTAGKPAKISIVLVDDMDTAVDASAVTWTLYDDRGNQLYTGASSGFTASDAAAVVELTAEQTTIDDPLAAREIVLECETASGAVEVREAVLFVSSAPLAVAVNSFQTATEAVATRAEIARLDGYDAAAKAQRTAAMIEAHRRILRVALQIPQAFDINNIAWGSRRVPLARLTEADFRKLPEDFQRAVRRAQVIEANQLLEINTVAQKRREGVVSETIGEASMFLNSKPYLNLPISRETYEELKQFVVLVVEIARA